MAGILLVDDSKTVRILVRAMLEKLGHTVVGEAADGLEGCEKYFALKPDITLVDITMPVMGGIATVQKITEKDKDAQIIILTSNTNTDKLKNAVEANVSEILFKPVDEHQLEEAINRILHKGDQ